MSEADSPSMTDAEVRALAYNAHKMPCVCGGSGKACTACEVVQVCSELILLRQAEADWEAHDARPCPDYQHCDVHCPGEESYE